MKIIITIYLCRPSGPSPSNNGVGKFSVLYLEKSPEDLVLNSLEIFRSNEFNLPLKLMLPPNTVCLGT